MNKKKAVITTVMLGYVLLAVIANVSADKNKDKDTHTKKTVKQDKKIRMSEKRRARRAFYSAPPVVPHEVTSRGSRACLTCHQKVFEVGGEITIKTPHPQFSNCLQCHVQGKLTDIPDVASDWIGLDSPMNSSQAHEYAPPTIPHRTFLRENCLSCHGPEHTDEGLRTSHPERSNCMQCHVPVTENLFNLATDE